MKPETDKAIKKLASLAELAAEVRRAALPDIEVGRPEGGISAAEYSRESGLGISAARTQLEKLVAKGEYVGVWAIAPTLDGAGRPLKQKFYRKVQR